MKIKKVGLIIKGVVLAGLVMALIGVITAQAQTVSTFVSGIGASDVAFDSSGNMYVTAGNRILKVTSAGVVSTFAGSGTYGHLDGPAATAQFASPTQLTVDSNGNVFVADSDADYPIRKITKDGNVSTLKSFLAPKSSLKAINAMVADSSGNLFFFGPTSENYTQFLYKMEPTGTLTTVAGRSNNMNIIDGTGSSAAFRHPRGLVIDSMGNLVTIDFYESGSVFLRKITPGYTVTSIQVSTLFQPVDLAVDSTGNTYITDGSVGKKIVKVNNVGAVSTYAGTGTNGSTDGAASTATFSAVYGAAISGGMLYVTDYNNQKIRKMDITLLTRKNVALSSNGGVATASSIANTTYYPVSGTINGDRNGINWARGGGGWQDGTANLYPDWIQVDFSGTKSVDEIDVFTTQSNFLYPVQPTETLTTTTGIADFEVQYWNGSSWVTIPNGRVTGNNLVWKKFTFSAIPTSKIRVNITKGSSSGSSRITELEAWGLN